ncbi:hypothetical protein, partial [Roseovarius sp. SYSU LYC5161]|uniref:hypothetical protein n=1 Tax=Roseovarius halophilus (ex Wu et al. 2025) TaxID=3376060 RepID=UPI00399A946F
MVARSCRQMRLHIEHAHRFRNIRHAKRARAQETGGANFLNGAALLAQDTLGTAPEDPPLQVG